MDSRHASAYGGSIRGHHGELGIKTDEGLDFSVWKGLLCLDTMRYLSCPGL